MINLTELLRTGTIRGLSTNNVKEDFIHELGEPSDIGSLNEIQILKYRNVEISFYKGILRLIAIYNRGEEIFLHDKELLYLKFSDFLNFLDDHDISWSADARDTTPGDVSVIRLDHAVTIQFDPETNMLHSVMREFF